jgi:metal-responsive CopG/Arc/MetJ family transcriptional regulator
MRGYTLSMKTAISIPDHIFEEAERLARRLKKSRSHIYSRAVAEYIARHGSEHVTEAMDRVWGAIGSGSTDFVDDAARRILGRTEW